MRGRSTDPAAIEAEIAHLRSLALDALRRHWRVTFGRPLPADLSKDLLGRMIAYRLQERAFGGLDRESLRFLHGLARHGGSPRRRLKPGTVLVPTIRASATPSPSSAMASTGRAQHDLPVGELQRVVMHVGTVHVELPEPGHLIGGHFNRRVARDIFGRHLLAPRALGGDGVRDGTGRWAPTCFSSPQGASTIRNSGRWRPRTLWKEPFLLVPGYPASGALR